MALFLSRSGPGASFVRDREKARRSLAVVWTDSRTVAAEHFVVEVAAGLRRHRTEHTCRRSTRLILAFFGSASIVVPGRLQRFVQRVTGPRSPAGIPAFSRGVFRKRAGTLCQCLFSLTVTPVTRPVDPVGASTAPDPRVPLSVCSTDFLRCLTTAFAQRRCSIGSTVLRTDDLSIAYQPPESGL
jgi:hypothetical protein